MGGMFIVLKVWEDIIGFFLLGGLLGLVLSFFIFFSYLVVFRVGVGFEYIENFNIS